MMLLSVDIIELSTSAANFIPTLLLLVMVLYWLTVLLGALDINSFDFDLDVDADVEIDVDADADADHSAEGSNSDGSFFNGVLTFFNIGKIPFMILMTFVAFPLWAISIIANALFGNETLLISLLLLIPNLVVSLLIAKIMTTPFVRIFASLKEKERSREDLVGSICSLRLPCTDTAAGQAEINIEGTSILINVMATRGNAIRKGNTGLVIQYNEPEDFYLVEPYESE